MCNFLASIMKCIFLQEIVYLQFYWRLPVVFIDNKSAFIYSGNGLE